MSPEIFCYWFEHFANHQAKNGPTPEQWARIKETIDAVILRECPPAHLPTMEQIGPYLPVDKQGFPALNYL